MGRHGFVRHHEIMKGRQRRTRLRKECINEREKKKKEMSNGMESLSENVIRETCYGQGPM